MTDDDKALVERLAAEADKALVERLAAEADNFKVAREVDMRGMLYRAADRIEDLSAENERLRDTPNRIWAEARDSEWDEGFNYAVKLFRAALGDKQ